MSEIYWITRCDAICNTSLVFFIISSIISTVAFIIYLCATAEKYDKDIAITKKIMRMFIPTFLINLLVFIFTPTTKEAMAIYGVGGTIDYIKQNPIAKQIPDKCINALDKWVDSWTVEKRDSIKK